MFARTRRTLDEAEAITLEIEVGALEPIIAHALGREHLNSPLPSAVTGKGAPEDILPTMTHEQAIAAGWKPEPCGCEDWTDHEYHASLPVSDPAYCDGRPIGGPNGCFCEGPCGHRFV